jgi:hypothetical protein
MHVLPLLGKALKDDDVIDLLEDLEMPVTYDFDRLHEGQPDKYWAAAQQAGIQLRFDESQTLDVVFLYIEPDEGFAAYKQGNLDVPIFANIPETQSFGESHRLQIKTGRADFLGVISDWIRLGFGTHFVHYDFSAGRLARVTVMRDAP